MPIWPSIFFVCLATVAPLSHAWAQSAPDHRLATLESELPCAAVSAAVGSADGLGCFGPQERLLFGGAWMTLPEAEASGQATVTMVGQGSTPERLVLEEVPIKSFYHHHYKGGLITIQTWDGDRLRVTMTHPVVLASGEYIMAQNVAVGMVLWGVDGPTTVMRTRQSPYDGEVWHIEPSLNASGLQAVLSQHLLSGSLPVQKALIAQSPEAQH